VPNNIDAAFIKDKVLYFIEGEYVYKMKEDYNDRGQWLRTRVADGYPKHVCDEWFSCW